MAPGGAAQFDGTDGTHGTHGTHGTESCALHPASPPAVRSFILPKPLTFFVFLQSLWPLCALWLTRRSQFVFSLCIQRSVFTTLHSPPGAALNSFCKTSVACGHRHRGRLSTGSLSHSPFSVHYSVLAAGALVYYSAFPFTPPLRCRIRALSVIRGESFRYLCRIGLIVMPIRQAALRTPSAHTTHTPTGQSRRRWTRSGG